VEVNAAATIELVEMDRIIRLRVLLVIQGLGGVVTGEGLAGLAVIG
jgi:hypothetical protein